jgi:hypothetical protein
LNTLIAAKEKVVGDGRLQVILALASVTTLVTVDATTSPPTITAPNLGQLTFRQQRLTDLQGDQDVTRSLEGSVSVTE